MVTPTLPADAASYLQMDLYRQFPDPVVYPDEYRIETNRKYDGRVFEPDFDDRKKYYEEKEKAASTMTPGITRMYVRGALYHNFWDPVPPEVIDITTGDISIKVLVSDGTYSTIRVVDVSGRKELLKSAVKMCGNLYSDPRYPGGHVRKAEDTGDLGRMATVGYYWGDYEAYTTIRDTCHGLVTRQYLGEMAIHYKQMMEDIFPNELEEIKEAERLQGKNHHDVSEMMGLSSSFQTTENTASPSHVDLDASRSVAIWATSENTNPSSWLFLFPNVGRNGRMLVIKLRHGIAASWDGRILKHCTSHTKNIGVNNKNCYAVMLGSSSARKG